MKTRITQQRRIHFRSPEAREQARKALAADNLSRDAVGAAIAELVEMRGLKRSEAALLVDDAASQLSRLLTGHVHEFSVDRLVGMILGLGGSVDLVIALPRSKQPKTRGRARVRVGNRVLSVR